MHNEIDRLRKVVGGQVNEIAALTNEIAQKNYLLGKLVAHSEYERLGASIGITVADKQAAYGDSFGRSGSLLRILYPDGIRPEQYDDALAVTRIIDKLFRIATDRDALGESPYRDIAGYAILGIAKGNHNGSETTEDQR